MKRGKDELVCGMCKRNLGKCWGYQKPHVMREHFESCHLEQLKVLETLHAEVRAAEAKLNLQIRGYVGQGWGPALV